MNQVSNFKITEFELDQVKEVVNIGASYASTALNQLTKRTINITVPEVAVTHVESSSEFIGNSEKIATTVLLKILGDTTGIMFFLFLNDSGLKLARLINQEEEPMTMLSENDRSVLREVGNIMSGACLSALSKFLGISLLHSVSEVVTDMLGSIVNSVMAEVGRESDVCLLFRVHLTVEGKDINAQLFFLADPNFTEQILKITRKKIS